ncbi:hypothetical protein B0H11DRAFT_1940812 [Mycena galericulata]|nr:hypothetical protein B0H11DRAFT_1940812 [Mycena galericulata]
MGRTKKESTNFKICHCKPTCGKLRSARTWRDHYLRVPRESIRPSASPPPQPNSDVDMDDEETPLPFPPVEDDLDSSVAHLSPPTSVESDWDYELSASEDEPPVLGNLESSMDDADTFSDTTSAATGETVQWRAAVKSNTKLSETKSHKI